MQQTLPTLPTHLQALDQRGQTYVAMAIVEMLLTTFQTTDGFRAFMATGKPAVLDTLKGFDEVVKQHFPEHPLAAQDYNVIYVELAAHLDLLDAQAASLASEETHA